MWKKTLTVVCTLALLIGFVSSANAQERLEFAYVEWDCAVASTHVAEAVLQEELGYDVTTVPVSAAAMWQGVADGDVDAHVAAWLPITHQGYYEANKDDIVELGTLVEGARIGLVVPEYVEADSIEDLNDYVDQFDGEITGIDPGAGIMSATESAIEEYNLDFSLLEGSDATMTGALDTAIRMDDWIVVTGWTPHWKFARYDLKYLEDPKGTYGEAERIEKIARQGLQDDAPEAYQFLDNFYLTQAELGEVMELNTEYPDDLYANAVQFIEENPDLVEKWLGN